MEHYGAVSPERVFTKIKVWASENFCGLLNFKSYLSSRRVTFNLLMPGTLTIKETK